MNMLTAKTLIRLSVHVHVYMCTQTKQKLQSVSSVTLVLDDDGFFHISNNPEILTKNHNPNDSNITQK